MLKAGDIIDHARPGLDGGFGHGGLTGVDAEKRIGKSQVQRGDDRQHPPKLSLHRHGFGAGPGGLAAHVDDVGPLGQQLATVVHRGISPLASLLAGMAVRSAPPLAVCLMLAAQGGGRQH